MLRWKLIRMFIYACWKVKHVTLILKELGRLVKIHVDHNMNFDVMMLWNMMDSLSFQVFLSSNARTVSVLKYVTRTPMHGEVLQSKTNQIISFLIVYCKSYKKLFHLINN